MFAHTLLRLRQTELHLAQWCAGCAVFSAALGGRDLAAGAATAWYVYQAAMGLGFLSFALGTALWGVPKTNRMVAREAQGELAARTLCLLLAELDGNDAGLPSEVYDGPREVP